MGRRPGFPTSFISLRGPTGRATGCLGACKLPGARAVSKILWPGKWCPLNPGATSPRPSPPLRGGEGEGHCAGVIRTILSRVSGYSICSNAPGAGDQLNDSIGARAFGVGFRRHSLCSCSGGWEEWEEWEVWQMADGKWQMANGRWQMANGRWQMANGRWQMADGRWQMANGKVIQVRIAEFGVRNGSACAWE